MILLFGFIHFKCLNIVHISHTNEHLQLFVKVTDAIYFNSIIIKKGGTEPYNYLLMLQYFKRLFKAKSANRNTEASLKLVDLDSKPLQDGDRVLSLRYGLGECILKAGSEGIFYEAIETGERVSYTRMVDASTNFQKVRKLK